MEAGILTGEEVHIIRPIWEEVFAEDSKTFTDYYFENKAERNLVLIRKDGEQIAAMLHLTPYVTGECRPVSYIVGVATKEAYRRRGLMRSLLEEALQFLWEEGHGFTFLMPANPAYYSPFDFAYIYDKKSYTINSQILPVHILDRAAEQEASFHLLVKDYGTLDIAVAKEQDYAEICTYVNQKLAKESDCFMLRTPLYYDTLKKELLAQNGNLFLIRKDGKTAGVLAYTKEEDKPGIQEWIGDTKLVECGLVEEGADKPCIMGRIVNVKEFLEALAWQTADFYLEVNDSIIKENTGVYHIQSGLAEKTTTTKQWDVSVDIGRLTEFCFGRKNAGECFVFRKEKEANIRQQLEQVCRIRNTFINEIV